jgi:hypothetical protein
VVAAGKSWKRVSGREPESFPRTAKARRGNEFGENISRLPTPATPNRLRNWRREIAVAVFSFVTATRLDNWLKSNVVLERLKHLPGSHTVKRSLKRAREERTVIQAPGASCAGELFASMIEAAKPEDTITAISVSRRVRKVQAAVAVERT